MRQLTNQEINTTAGGIFIDIGFFPPSYYYPPVVEIYDVYPSVTYVEYYNPWDYYYEDVYYYDYDPYYGYY